jgi:hypothetical protein
MHGYVCLFGSCFSVLRGYHESNLESCIQLYAGVLNVQHYLLHSYYLHGFVGVVVVRGRKERCGVAWHGEP